MLYLKAVAPIVPVSLNSGFVWPRNSFIKKSGKVTIKFMPAIPQNLDLDSFMKKLEFDIESKAKA